MSEHQMTEEQAAELADLRAMKARLDERRDSLGLDAHLHGRLLRILDEIAGDS